MPTAEVAIYIELQRVSFNTQLRQTRIKFCCKYFIVKNLSKLSITTNLIIKIINMPIKIIINMPKVFLV